VAGSERTLQETASAERVAVYLELGAKRVFACSLDWPGWCRSAKTESQALEALAAYARRYASVAAEAGDGFSVSIKPVFDVVERLSGSATTDFGAPDAIASSDRDAPPTEEAGRLARLVAAAWTVLDQVVATAPPELRKGPRGGGRDRDAVAQHVLSAGTAYARKLGMRLPGPNLADRAAVERLRQAILTALRAGAPDAPVNGWPPRYAARRIAWHALDHAWEIEDRGGPAPA